MTQRTAGQRRPLAVWVAALGLFTVSWDRFLNVEVGTYNAKLPFVFFGVALLLVSVDALAKEGVPPKRLPFAGATALLVATMLLPWLWAVDSRAVLLQVGTVILGAFVPAAACYLVAVRHQAVEFLLTAFIKGGWVAALFGLYQLAALRVGLPQIVEYSGTVGGLGRISSFSYEPGYFGYFLVAVVAAMFARGYLTGEQPSVWHLGFFVAVLLLINSRSVFLTLPVLGLLLIAPATSVQARRRTMTAMVWLVPVGVAAVLAWPDRATALVDRARSILDPYEETSNAPRLQVLALTRRVIEDNPWGIGAGNFYRYASTTAADEQAAANETVVNNIVLQALVDGGWAYLLAHLLLVATALRFCFRRTSPAARALISGWLTVLLVGGLVVSYFYDVEMWAVLGLAAAMAAAERGSGRTETRATAGPHAGRSAKGRQDRAAERLARGRG